MNNQQLINEIENKIQSTQSLINNYKNELASHENILTQLIKQLSEIKQNMKITNNKNNALNGANNNK